MHSFVASLLCRKWGNCGSEIPKTRLWRWKMRTKSKREQSANHEKPFTRFSTFEFQKKSRLAAAEAKWLLKFNCNCWAQTTNDERKKRDMTKIQLLRWMRTESTISQNIPHRHEKSSAARIPSTQHLPTAKVALENELLKAFYGRPKYRRLIVSSDNAMLFVLAGNCARHISNARWGL